MPSTVWEEFGRAALKILLDSDGPELAAVNDIAAADNLAYLISYDTVYGRYHRKISADDGALVVDDRRIPVFTERDPGAPPWGDLQGRLGAGVHRCVHHRGGPSAAHSRWCVVRDPIRTDEIGDRPHRGPRRQPPRRAAADHLVRELHHQLHYPVVEIAHRRIGVERAVMTTVHAYTATQQLVDGPSKSFRRGRQQPPTWSPRQPGRHGPPPAPCPS